MANLVTRRMLVLSVAVSSLFGLAPPVMAEVKSMSIPLSGATEVPPVQTPGKGNAALSYDSATRKLTWSIEFSDLSGGATMAHFHGPAAPGKNGPPVLWIVEKGVTPVSPIKGSAVLTPEQAAEFTEGKWYLNIHSSANTAGEIRGLVPAIK